MRVVHVAPTAFGTEGIYGGGEQYPLELARALAAHVDCTLLTFARRGRPVQRDVGGLRVEVLPARGHLRRHPAHPVAPGLPRALAGYDVVHAHQLWATPSRVAAVAARVRHQPVTIAGTPGHDLKPPESGYASWLRQLAAQDGRRVRFLGAVSDAELLELYRRTAVMVLPSVEESCYGKHVRISELLGLSVLEAMACGAPVVASRLGGVPEVVRHGDTGFLAEPGDVDDLRRRLEELLEDPPLARRLGDNARQLVVERFTWDACARRCLEAYAGMGATGAW